MTKIEERKVRHEGRIVVGIIFVVLGLICLCAKLDIDFLGEWRNVFFSWEMFVVILGIILFGNGKRMGGFLFLGVGLFYMTDLNPVSMYISFDTGKWWPMLLIYCGVVMLLFSKTRKKIYIETEDEARQNGANQQSTIIQEEANLNDGKIQYEKFLSGGKVKVSEPLFCGGNVRIMLGGLELDLRETDLPVGETHLYCDLCLGGITIFAPSNWLIEVDSQCFVGGFTDKRQNVSVTDTAKRLKIHCKTAFGGGDIR